MKLSEIKELQTSELNEKLLELKQELFTIRFQQKTGQKTNAIKKRSIRKDIARILTIIKERQIQQGTQK